MLVQLSGLTCFGWWKRYLNDLFRQNEPLSQRRKDQGGHERPLEIASLFLECDVFPIEQDVGQDTTQWGISLNCQPMGSQSKWKVWVDRRSRGAGLLMTLKQLWSNLGFSVFLKDTFTCGQEEVGLKPPIFCLISDLFHHLSYRWCPCVFGHAAWGHHLKII